MSMKGRGGQHGRSNFKKEKPEFDQQIVDLARVTRVTKGGKHLSFRAVVVIGDRKGRVGYGIDKGKDVQIGVAKAANQAKKNVITVPIIRETIPHSVVVKYKSAQIILMPAPRGSGIIAGGAVRTVLEMAGVPNASAKILSRAKNKMNNIKATFLALQSFKLSQKKAKKDIHAEMAEAEVKATDNLVVTKADEAAPIVEVDTLKKKERPPMMMKKWPVKH